LALNREPGVYKAAPNAALFAADTVALVDIYAVVLSPLKKPTLFVPPAGSVAAEFHTPVTHDANVTFKFASKSVIV
jgi:hypothetical protein